MTRARISPEECARRVLQREIGRPVIRHDDGSKPGMYDLRVGTAEAPDIAIECVAAVDPTRTETWNIGPARGPLSLALRGDWYVKIRPHASLKHLHRGLENVLRTCEEAGLVNAESVDLPLRLQDRELLKALDSLNIASIQCYRPEGTGTVHLTMTGVGGAVDPSGRAVPGWVGEFLRARDRTDVLEKLFASGAGECHVFIPASLGGVPWPVESYLGTDTDSLPVAAPDLPAPVGVVWIIYGRRGLRWDGRTWSFFDATVPPAGE